MHYDVREAPLTEDALAALLALSRDWEAEGSCTGYRANVAEDLAGCRVFLAEAEGRVLGYLFGRHCPASRETSVMPEGTQMMMRGLKNWKPMTLWMNSLSMRSVTS